MQEVKEAVFSINSEKAPGPDGFTGDFFKQNWEVIKEDVYKEVCAFFDSYHSKIMVKTEKASPGDSIANTVRFCIREIDN